MRVDQAPFSSLAAGLKIGVHITDTLYASRGRIPPEFLRGCGLQEWEAEAAKLYDRSLRPDQSNDIWYEIYRLREGAPIMFHSVFISYSSKDQAFAEALHGRLQGAGVRCWFAPHDMRNGKKLHHQIDRAIHQQDRLLLILSESSMESDWVATEISRARKKEQEQNRQVLFPIRLASMDDIKGWVCFDADIGKDSAKEVREYLIPDFSEWKDETTFDDRMMELVRDLRTDDKPVGLR